MLLLTKSYLYISLDTMFLKSCTRWPRWNLGRTPKRIIILSFPFWHPQHLPSTIAGASWGIEMHKGILASKIRTPDKCAASFPAGKGEPLSPDWRQFVHIYVLLEALKDNLLTPPPTFSFYHISVTEWNFSRECIHTTRANIDLVLKPVKFTRVMKYCFTELIKDPFLHCFLDTGIGGEFSWAHKLLSEWVLYLGQ